MEMQENAVSIENFEEGIKMSSPMSLDRRREKSAYDYFLGLGDSFIDSLASGKSPFLPNKDGFVDLQPAYNINNNTKSQGLTQIVLLTKAAELEVPSSGFVTFETVKNAQSDGVECKVIKGSKGAVIPVVEENDWSKIKFKNTWFNISQIENSENLIAYCKEKMTEQYEKDVQYIKEHYPNSTYKEKKNPADFVMSKPNEKIVPLNEKTREPFEYLAQVLNAVQTGRKLYVSPEQAETFKIKAIELLSTEYQPGKRDVMAFKKLCTSAEKLYLTNKKHLEMYQQKEKQKQGKSVEKEARTKEPSYEIGM